MKGRQLFFFFGNMLRVNVAKSSLHLHILKTLEFRANISDKHSRSGRSHEGLPLDTHHPQGDPRSESQNNSLPRSFCSSCTLPGLVHVKTTYGHQISEGLCASALRRGRFLFHHLLKLRANALPVESGCLALPQPGPLGLRSRC